MMTTDDDRKDHDAEDHEDWLARRLAAGVETKMLHHAPDLKSRLLADYDAFMRARRNEPLHALAEAFGWPALSRPWAPASLGATMVALGALLGATTSTGAAASEDEAYVYLSAALDRSFDLTKEYQIWDAD
ncbi:MAG: hypothetical protein ACKVS5_00235 [Parvularculaceae bacterium]